MLIEMVVGFLGVLFMVISRTLRENDDSFLSGLGLVFVMVSYSALDVSGQMTGGRHMREELTQVIPQTEVSIKGQRSFEVRYIVTYSDGQLKSDGIKAVPGSVHVLTATAGVN